MSELVDQTIAELRANHERLAAYAASLTEDQLAGPSGASEWTVAEVFSHLGSGAEISRSTLLDSLGHDGEQPGNQEVWDRWNAMSPAEQAAGFVEHDGVLVDLYESLTPEQRATTQVELGFLPAPVSLAVPLAMRLSEQTLHGWDARVGVDADAALSDDAAHLLLRHHAESMPFLLGYVGKADKLDEPVRLAVGDHTLVVDDAVSIEPGTQGTTATYAGPLEAAVRLLAGRLAPEHTPETAEVTGNVSLDDLRRVFPGY
jgi:uncharacterized protein (TIGR03083 family)